MATTPESGCISSMHLELNVYGNEVMFWEIDDAMREKRTASVL